MLDIEVLICDADANVLKFVPARHFVSNIQEGTKATGGTVTKCIVSQETVKSFIPTNVHGFKVRTYATPVFEEDGTFSGVIATGTNMSAHDSLYEASQTMTSTSEQMTVTAKQLTSSAIKLADDLQRIQNITDGALEEIKKTDDILEIVSSIALDTNILGINAAIVAARAGEQGRGFSVVAREIRKLAATSSDSVEDIKKILQRIQTETKKIFDIISETSKRGEDQATATEEIGASMQQLALMAKKINEIPGVEDVL